MSPGTAALEDPTISTRVRRLRRRRSSGQGLVEFAIVGGLLFFLIFSVMNAGFYLYGANAMQYAADIGVATIAAEGNYNNTWIPQPNNADTVAIARMESDGLASTPLVSVTRGRHLQGERRRRRLQDATELRGRVRARTRTTVAGTPIGTIQWIPPCATSAPPLTTRSWSSTSQYTLLIGTTTFNSTTVNLFRLEPQQ